jgi:DNA repair exonuclease SbcCD nuclease subunit
MMPMADTRKLTLRCPDCGSDLVVDAATGEVLSHRKAKQPIAGGRDLDSLFQELDSNKAKAQNVFEREVAAMKDRDRLMEEKFREALKRAEEDPDQGPPRRPFDLD